MYNSGEGMMPQVRGKANKERANRQNYQSRVEGKFLDLCANFDF